MGAGLTVAKALVTDGQRDLFSESLKQGGRFLPEIVAEVDVVHLGANEVPDKGWSCFFNDAYRGSLDGMGSGLM